jgi:hypothetical protein
MPANNAIRKFLAAVSVAAAMAAAVLPTWADGSRRAWRGSPYAVGAISRNVITPYYYGYHGGHYSYMTPDPVTPDLVPSPTYVRYTYAPPICWSPGFGYRYWVCRADGQSKVALSRSATILL